MTEYRPRRNSGDGRSAGSRKSDARSTPRARSGSTAPRHTSATRRPPTSAPRKKGRRTPKRRGRILRWVLLCAAIAVVLLGGLGGVAYARLDSSLPDPDLTQARGRDQTTTILDRNGVVLAKLYADQNRVDKSLAKMPAALRQAVIATEDQRFYQHSGVDPIGILRALVNDYVLRKPRQGGSTITQQYVKNAFGSTDVSFKRKIMEAMLASKVNKLYSKDQVLELYMNTICFGHGAWGVESAAQLYFGKSVENLTLAESAMLAGVIKSPGTYSPYVDLTAAKQRRDTVLSQMLSQGYISQADYDAAVATPVKPVGLKSAASNAPYFVQWVTAQLVGMYGDDVLYRDGLTITTTLDLTTQQAAEKAIADTLNKPEDPSAALVSIRPGTGEVLAMVGGRDFKTQQFNAAVGKGRQPGSTFKPFVLITALTQGISPEQTYSSAAIDLPVGNEIWSVKGEPGGTGEPLRLRVATEQSVNAVYAQLVIQVTPQKVVQTAEKMGIHTGISPVPAIALGVMDMNPLEMAAAYATLATNGTYAAPYGITEVKDAAGKVLYSAKPQTSQVINPAIAYLTTDILRGVISKGTGTGAQIGRPAAGKTGTTENNADAWFVGYTPQLATAVWMGYVDSQKPMTNVHGKLVTGGSFPATMWAKFMKAALASTPAQDFTQPSGLTKITVCQDTGLAATASCPKTADSLFLAGTQLTSCTLHVAPTTITMPNLVGMTKAQALTALSNLKLAATIFEKSVSGVTAGTVAAQTPAAGSSVTEGAAVTVTIAASPADKAPTAEFSIPVTANVNESVAIDGSLSKDDGTVVEWYWEFDDGTLPSNGTKVTHQWKTTGDHKVTLKVTDNSGQATTITKTIKIQ
ncbi:MAG: PBP1A family penicillin-binding protein [Coriobacteriia bacterium]|nr:PBP1A family penicillin-binding protein [Coriobacteriia bacterium]